MCVCRLETGRDDLRVRSEVLEREVADLQHQNEDLTSLAEEAQNLKDEMDILRYKDNFISLFTNRHTDKSSDNTEKEML